MIAYPDNLPLACVQYVINAVRNRTVAADKQEFFLCLWNVQGYLQRTLIGVPENPSHGALSAGEPGSPDLGAPALGLGPAPADFQDLYDTLVEFDADPVYNPDTCEAVEIQESGLSGQQPTEAIPWAMIIQVVIPLLLKWLENKKTE